MTEGRLLALWWAVLAAALVNAAVEEIVYRGFLQPAFVRLGGIGPGLWTTGMMFGLLHGASASASSPPCRPRC